jgi:hypothetical protein
VKALLIRVSGIGGVWGLGFKEVKCHAPGLQEGLGFRGMPAVRASEGFLEGFTVTYRGFEVGAIDRQAVSIAGNLISAV